jgi:SAM-dependent methyltransferase
VEQPVLGPSEAAIFETFVVPRYLSIFVEGALEWLLPAEGARLAHLGCRTGYPEEAIAARLPGASIVGVDPSPSALEVARAKALALPDLDADYVEAPGLPTPLQAGGFSHVLCLHPFAPLAPHRRALAAEAARLLAPGGQLLVALPMRGCFQEIVDLLREYALKHDLVELGKQIDAAALARATAESITDDLEDAGLADVDVELRRLSLDFGGGRDLIEDPAWRLMLLPDLRASLPGVDLDPLVAYLREAIDRYWAEGRFDLSLHVGFVSARQG